MALGGIYVEPFERNHLATPQPRWYGPIVTNTQAELRRAFEELEQGTFLKQQGPVK